MSKYRVEIHIPNFARPFVGDMEGEKPDMDFNILQSKEEKEGLQYIRAPDGCLLGIIRSGLPIRYTEYYYDV